MFLNANCYKQYPRLCNPLSSWLYVATQDHSNCRWNGGINFFPCKNFQHMAQEVTEIMVFWVVSPYNLVCRCELLKKYVPSIFTLIQQQHSTKEHIWTLNAMKTLNIKLVITTYISLKQQWHRLNTCNLQNYNKNRNSISRCSFVSEYS
jgi:hypothetical protein